MTTHPHVLIVGSGSVGKRHARNFACLGSTVYCVDPRSDRRAELASETRTAGAYETLEAALAAARFDAAIICSPPHMHTAQTVACIERGLPVLLEKPLSVGLQAASAMVNAQRQHRVPVLLGYTWRWWPPLREVRELLARNVIGKLHHVRFVMSANLSDWHPWERYQDFFMARREHGGGALLDESHWIDLACWLFGEPQEVIARVERVSTLQIDSDDNVDMLLAYSDGLRVSLHLDLFGRPHEKTITFVGENGTLRWSADPNQICIGTRACGWDRVEEFRCERNDMFVAVAREFLEVLQGRSPSCSIDEGMLVLKIVEAARRSSESGAVVRMDEVCA